MLSGVHKSLTTTTTVKRTINRKKKKNTHLTNNEKLKVLTVVDENPPDGKTKTEIATDFGIDTRTLRRIIQDREFIQSNIGNPEKKRPRTKARSVKSKNDDCK